MKIAQWLGDLALGPTRKHIAEARHSTDCESHEHSRDEYVKFAAEATAHLGYAAGTGLLCGLTRNPYQAVALGAVMDGGVAGLHGALAGRHLAKVEPGGPLNPTQETGAGAGVLAAAGIGEGALVGTVAAVGGPIAGVVTATALAAGYEAVRYYRNFLKN